MSAWIVSKKHIDVLVAAADLPTQAERNELGQLLWDENHKSVNYRYTEQRPTPRYTFTAPPAPLNTPTILKQINCLDYQSCEHEGWGSSKAFAWLKKLEEMLVPANQTAAQMEATPEYNKAPWGIE